jgi:hypothetical protein
MDGGKREAPIERHAREVTQRYDTDGVAGALARMNEIIRREGLTVGEVSALRSKVSPYVFARERVRAAEWAFEQFHMGPDVTELRRGPWRDKDRMRLTQELALSFPGAAEPGNEQTAWIHVDFVNAASQVIEGVSAQLQDSGVEFGEWRHIGDAGESARQSGG